MEEKHTKVTKLVARFATERQHLSHNHTFFEDHDQCPMCTQTIDDGFKSAKLADTAAALAKMDTDYQEAQQIAAKLAKRWKMHVVPSSNFSQSKSRASKSRNGSSH